MELLEPVQRRKWHSFHGDPGTHLQNHTAYRKELLFLLHPCLLLCQINPCYSQNRKQTQGGWIHLEICNWLWFFSHEATEPQWAKSSGPGWLWDLHIWVFIWEWPWKNHWEGICDPSIQARLCLLQNSTSRRKKKSIIGKDKRLQRERMAVPFPLHL